MSGQNREHGVEAPGPIDRMLDRDRDDKADILEGGAERADMTTTRQARSADMLETREGEIRVPVAEERLAVGKREVELGEVEIHRTVTQEQVSVPVELRHEEVRVEEVDIADRPLRAGEDVFQEGTIRVAVRGEEAVVAKEAVVTGEVVINKEQLVEQQTITDTVRREHVDVERHFQEARAGFQQEFETRRTGAADEWSRSRTFEQAEPNYRAGFTAGHDLRYQGRQFEEIEPDLRREYETSASGTTGGTRAGTAGGGDTWERLREEIRSGFNRARSR
jgi:uncharacterized protein (TIGR02271 family)